MARYSSGATFFPVCPTCQVGGTQPASQAARDAAICAPMDRTINEDAPSVDLQAYSIASGAATKAMSQTWRQFLAVSVIAEQNGKRLKRSAGLSQSGQSCFAMIFGE